MNSFLFFAVWVRETANDHDNWHNHSIFVVLIDKFDRQRDLVNVLSGTNE